MPSPVGHALAGVAAGSLLQVSVSRLAGSRSRSPRTGRRRWRIWCVSIWGICGMLPDADFLVGAHSTFTHSVGATLVVGLAGFIAGRWGIGSGGITAATLAAAYGSHPLLDYLGSDPVEPFGIMVWWPFSTDFYLSGHHWFLAVCREYWELSCWTHNALGVAWELAALAPLAGLGVWLLSFRPPLSPTPRRNQA